jgi:hypothetical protein
MPCCCAAAVLQFIGSFVGNALLGRHPVMPQKPCIGVEDAGMQQHAIQHDCSTEKTCMMFNL